MFRVNKYAPRVKGKGRGKEEKEEGKGKEGGGKEEEEEEGEGRRRETGRREKDTSRPHGDQQRLHVYASSGMV